MSTADSTADARAAFEEGDWERACELYEAVLADDPDNPEALYGLGEAWWFRCEIERGIELCERAYAAYRKHGDVCGAADVALWLAVEHSSSYGNAVVADGWFRRAARLLEGNEICPAHVELEIGYGRRASDPEQAVRHYEQAAAYARELGSVDLEIRALSQIGVLRVSHGDVEEGMGILDECMAAATGGELRDPLQIGSTCCMMLAACDQLSDLERAVQWCRVVTDFTRRRRYTPLFAWCRSMYAAVLVAMGEWERAEAELEASLAAYGGAGRPMSAYPLARLAELRLRQGRIEEAAQLLAGYEDHPRAAATAIAIIVARGELKLAEERLERRLAGVAADSPSAASLLPLLAAVRLRSGDADGAREAVERLRQLGRTLARETLVALAELWAGEVSAATRDGAALAHYEVALEMFRRLGMPHEQAKARLGIARELAARDTRDLAVAEARTACQLFERLGARGDADAAAALLRLLGVSGRSAPRGRGELTQREREVLELLGAGLSNPEIAQRLYISPKTAEHHVSRILRKLDLRSRQEAAAYAARRRLGTE